MKAVRPPMVNAQQPHNQYVATGRTEMLMFCNFADQCAQLWQMLVAAFINSRLDYGNSVLVGLPAYLIWRLQFVFNAAAWLIFHLQCNDNISDVLVCLHWLWVLEQVEFKIAALTHKVLCGTAPRYLGPLNRVADVSGRRSISYSGGPTVSLYHPSDFL